MDFLSSDDSYEEVSIFENHMGKVIAKYNFRQNRQGFTKEIYAVPNTFVMLLKSALLPEGYPGSVSKDYLEYQIWDTIQAIASSITGTLAGQAVLIGVGVGNASASVLAATLTWMFKDGAGMVGRILFAAWGGSSLDSQCKQWRIFADVLNDLSLLLELLSVRIYYLFTPVVCFASVMRALVGMVGGATRAAITQHQALANNMADVAAKDGSQETLSNLVALAVNFLLITIVTGKPVLIWLVFALLTPLHLYANWRAVRCLQFDTLNRARFRILIEDWLRKHDEMSDRLPPLLSVREVNHREPIVYPSWGDSRGRTIHLGCSFETLTQMKDCKLQPLMGVYAKEKYILYSPEWKYSGYREYHLPIYICLHTDADTMDIFKALFHAEIVCALCYEGADCESFKQFWVGDDGIAFFAWTLGRATFWMTRILKSFSEHNSRRGEAQWSLSSLQVDAKPWRIHRNLYRVAAPEEVSTSKKCA